MQQIGASDNGERPEYIFDGMSGTGFSKLGIKGGSIDIDLGDAYELAEVRYIPYQQMLFDKGVSYDLFYWKDGWNFLDNATFNGKPLVFSKIPQNALLLLRPEIETGRMSYRPFIYVDDEIQWY